jgi:hypothetical protein
MVGGPLLLYLGSTGPQVQCAECGYIFAQPPLPRTATSTLALWFLALFVFATFAALLLVVGRDSDLLPEWPILPRIRQIAMENPQACFIGIFAVVLVCLAVSWASNRAAHRELRKRFETRPTKYAENRKETPSAPDAPHDR